MMFPRQIGLKRAVCRNRDEWTGYLNRLNGLSSIYTSLYAFDEMIDDRKPKYDSAIMNCAWWDFDMESGGTLDDVKRDVAILLDRLKWSDVRLVFTGRGFHVYQMFSKPVVGRAWAHRLDRYEKAMCENLPTLDGVGYPEKMARIPDTFNPKRGHWAVMCDTQKFMIDPYDYKIPTIPDTALSYLNPYTGISPRETAFSLTEWVRDNPEEKPEVRRTESVDIAPVAASVPLPNCLDRAIRVSNPPHHVRVALAQTMAHHLRWFAKPSDLNSDEIQEIEDTICGFIETLGWIDYHANITRKAVKSLMHYERAPTPIWYKKHNLCDGTNCWFCGGR